jgi:hypothetical protein
MRVAAKMRRIANMSMSVYMFEVVALSVVDEAYDVDVDVVELDVVDVDVAVEVLALAAVDVDVDRRSNQMVYGDVEPASYTKPIVPLYVSAKPKMDP